MVYLIQFDTNLRLPDPSAPKRLGADGSGNLSNLVARTRPCGSQYRFI